MMENDISGALDLSFTVSEEIFGQVKTNSISFQKFSTLRSESKATFFA